VIDLDGDGCSGRLGKLLTSGAVVLKPWAAGYPFYYRALHEWEHYVPLRPDLSDLPERVRWLQAHDAEAEAIGRRAAAFARAALSPASIDGYVAALLRTTAEEQPDASALEPAEGDVPVYRRGGSRAYSVLNATDHKGRRLDVVCPAAAADHALLEVSPAATLARQYFESAEAALEVAQRRGNLRRYTRPN